MKDTIRQASNLLQFLQCLICHASKRDTDMIVILHLFGIDRNYLAEHVHFRPHQIAQIRKPQSCFKSNNNKWLYPFCLHLIKHSKKLFPLIRTKIPYPSIVDLWQFNIRHRVRDFPFPLFTGDIKHPAEQSKFF